MITTLLSRAPALAMSLRGATQRQMSLQLAAMSSTNSHVLRYFATTTKTNELNPVPPAKAGNDDEIPSIFDQGTGLERAEIEDPDLFKHNEVLRGPFGTEENPVKIPSFYDHRIVGCTGDDDHDIVWLMVEKESPAQCNVCGQWFKLDPR